MRFPFLLTFLFLLSYEASAEEESPFLLGDWHGHRKSIEEFGLALESTSITELVHVFSGGITRGTKSYEDFDLTARLDTEKAGLWEHGQLFVYFNARGGGKPSAIVGDFQYTSNLEAPDGARLYEAWYEHQITERVSVLFGIQDFNSEFYVAENAAGLLNSSFEVGPETTQFYSPTYPFTSFATRLRLSLSERTYIMAGAYDGTVRTEKHPKHSNIEFTDDDGVFYIAEIGTVATEEESDSNYYKLAAGSWYHTTDFEDYQDVSRRRNHGAYILGEKLLYHSAVTGRRLGTFVQIGFAEQDRNQIGTYVGLGFNLMHPFEGRDDDILLIGIAHARNTEQYRRTTDGTDAAETAFEIAYRAKLLSAVTLIPDLQYVFNPSMDSALDSAIVTSLRLEISL